MIMSKLQACFALADTSIGVTQALEVLNSRFPLEMRNVNVYVELV
jgi:hypothetical protein